MAIAGLIESKKRRHFGTVVSIYKSTEAGMDDAGGEGKYSIVCEDHGYVIGVPTLKLARFHAPFFDCEFCTGVATEEESGAGDDVDLEEGAVTMTDEQAMQIRTDAVNAQDAAHALVELATSLILDSYDEELQEIGRLLGVIATDVLQPRADALYDEQTREEQ